MAANQDWDVGDTLHLTCNFTVSGTNTDPTTITLVVQQPNGTETTYTHAGGTVTKDSVGNYSKNVTTDASGVWAWRWVGTGACAAADEGKVTVSRSVME